MDIWEQLPQILDTHLSCFPCHEGIVKFLMSHEEDGLPNILMYGNHGFPKDCLWYIVSRRLYGNLARKEVVWNKEWTYVATSKYIEIDLRHPSQPKEMSSLSDFLKEVIMNTSFHLHRHIIVLKNIDYLCIRGYVGMLRVLLERYSHNAWFVCITNHVSKIEPPIRSRFMSIRVPLADKLEICKFLESSGNPIEPRMLDGPHAQNLHFHLYMAEMIKHKVPYDPDILPMYFAPVVRDAFPGGRVLPTTDQLRAITQKLCIHGFSFSALCLDVMRHLPEERYCEWLQACAETDHMCAKTDGYRKPLYVEYLLHVATYGHQKMQK